MNDRGPRRPPRAARGGGTPRGPSSRRAGAPLARPVPAPVPAVRCPLDRRRDCSHAPVHRRTTHGRKSDEHQRRPAENGPRTPIGQDRDRTAGKRRRALPGRRLALAGIVAAVAAWLFTGAGSDPGRSHASSCSRAAVRSTSSRGCVPVRIEAAGGSGGLQGAAGTPGLGARVTATLRVSPGPDAARVRGRARRDGRGRHAGPRRLERRRRRRRSRRPRRRTARAARAPAAEERPTSGVAKGGSRTASWSPAAAPAAAAAGSAAPTA